MTSADYVNEALKGIKEVYDNAMAASLEQFKENRAIAFYTTNVDDEIYNSTEGLTGIEALGEEETPPSLALEDGYTTTVSPARYGGAIVVPEKIYGIDKGDPTTKVDVYLRRQRDQLLKATQNKMIVDAFYILNNAHNASSLVLAPDSVELCGTHTWASGDTFDNSATAALDADAIDDMEEFGGAFTDPTDTTRAFPHNYDTIIVKMGSDAERMALKLFAFGISPISVADINIYKGTKTIVSSPYITPTNKAYWFGRDSRITNSVMLGVNRMPAMREPIKQNNEAIRSNVTTHYKRAIRNVPHDWYSGNGTT